MKRFYLLSVTLLTLLIFGNGLYAQDFGQESTMTKQEARKAAVALLRSLPDRYFADPEGYVFDERIMRELESVSHREYCTGYYLDDCRSESHLASSVGYIREKAYFSTAIEYDEEEAQAIMASDVQMENGEGKLYRFIQRNKVSAGEGAEMISPGKIGRGFDVCELYAPDGSLLGYILAHNGQSRDDAV